MSQCWYGNKEEEQLISDHELCVLPHCAFLPTLNMPLCAGWNRLNSDYIYIEFNHVSLLASAFLSLLIFPLFSYRHLFFSFSSGPVLLLLLLPLSYFIAFLCCFYTYLSTTSLHLPLYVGLFGVTVHNVTLLYPHS